MMIIKCHNCGIIIEPETKESLFVQINKIKAKFHNLICFTSWNKEYEGKYEGNIIE